MLNEIIESIGMDNILHELKNDKPLSGVYIKISKEDLISEKDIFDFDKGDEINVKDLEQADWFREREFYSNYISSNKSIYSERDYMMILSNQENSVMFNYLTINNKIKKFKDKKIILSEKEMLELVIRDYMNKLGSQKTDYYLKNLDTIINFINNNQLTKKVIKIFIDEPIDIYIDKHNGYMEDKIHDIAGCTINSKGEKIGLGSLFITQNSKKPFLSNVNNFVSDKRHLLTANEILRTMNLNRFICSKPKLDNNTKIGNITMELDVKDKVIIDYHNNPYQEIDDIFLEDNLVIHDRFNDNAYPHIISSSYGLKKYIEALDIKYVPPGKLSTFKYLYSKFYTDINRDNKYLFTKNIDKIIAMLNSQCKNVWDKDEEDYIMSKSVTNLDIALNDYFKNKTIGKDFEDMRELCTSKILNLEDMYNIESVKEFSYMMGVLANYYVRRSNVDKKNMMLNKYNNPGNLNKILDMIDRDVEKYEDKVNISSRSIKVYEGVLTYASSNDSIHIDKILFRLGLRASSNIIYTKKENK